MDGHDDYIASRVYACYWDEDVNCAMTMLKILSELFRVPLEKQILHAAVGMHGAGAYGAQCGLVEGSLMFIGVIGKVKNKQDTEIIKLCHDFARGFEEHFASLSCKILRPQGFSPDNPPHLCEPLTREAVKFTAGYLRANFRETERTEELC